MREVSEREADVAQDIKAAIAALERGTGRPAGAVTITCTSQSAAEIRRVIAAHNIDATVVVDETLPMHQSLVRTDRTSKPPSEAQAQERADPYWRHFERKPKRFRG